MLTEAVILATAMAVAAAGGSGIDASRCNEESLDRKYDNCVSMLHTGSIKHTNKSDFLQHFFFPT